MSKVDYFFCVLFVNQKGTRRLAESNLRLIPHTHTRTHTQTQQPQRYAQRHELSRVDDVTRPVIINDDVTRPLINCRKELSSDHPRTAVRGVLGAEGHEGGERGARVAHVLVLLFKKNI